MKEGDDVLIRVPGSLKICEVKTLCEVCLQWIKKGELFGCFEDEYGECELSNCLACINKKETT